MPDKQKENKLVAMLERRGYLQKRASEDEPTETETVGTPSRPEADLRYLFNNPDDDAPKVTPAPRQPVPGITNPVIPTERTQSSEQAEPRMTERVLPLQASRLVRGDPAPPKPVERELPRPEPTQPPAPKPIPKPAPVITTVDDYDEDVPVMQESPEPPPAPVKTPSFYIPPQPQPPVQTQMYERPPQPQPLPQQPAENYTERFMEIEELYEALALRSKRTDTIYLVEEYLKTLPDSLPDESRREIVSRIISASGFDYDLLTGDGVLRVKMLKDYAERFAQYTDDYVLARQAELEELDQQILRVRRLIENRRELHKKQFFAIETEAQRLKEILTFITG